MQKEIIEIQNKKMQIQWIHKELLKQNQPTIIFLHEALGSIDQWKSFPKDLSNKLNMPVLVYDRFGSGGSDPMDLPRKKGYLEKEAFEVLPELIKKLNLNQLILVGHSDGASISLLFASQFKNQSKMVISEATHVFVEDFGFKGLAMAKEAFENTVMREKLSKYHGNKTNDLFYAWHDTWASKEYYDWNMEDKIPKITCPVLVIQGENDEYASLEQVIRVSRKVSGRAEEFIVPNCAHIPHIQAKNVVLDKMTDFIRKNLV